MDGRVGNLHSSLLRRVLPEDNWHGDDVQDVAQVAGGCIGTMVLETISWYCVCVCRETFFQPRHQT